MAASPLRWRLMDQAIRATADEPVIIRLRGWRSRGEKL